MEYNIIEIVPDTDKKLLKKQKNFENFETICRSMTSII